jgi:uncharacterized protein YggE
MIQLIAFFAVLAASADDHVISTHGSCTRKVTADRGSVTVTAEHSDKDLKSAIKKTTEQYERVRAEIRKLGLENLELTTNEYDVREVVEWEKDKRVDMGKCLFRISELNME